MATDRARQGRAGQAKPGHSSVPGKSHDYSVLLQVSQLLQAGGSQHGVMGWQGGRREKRREVNRRPQREPVPVVQRTPAASSPRWVAVCVEMKPGVGGREGRASTHFWLSSTHLAFPTLQPTPLLEEGEGVGVRQFTRRPPPITSTSNWFSCR